MAARRRVEVSDDRGVFMISVAAELAAMHPQTLRMYEQRGLIEPKRSPKGTRLYSNDDVQRLRRIQEMTAELGMNLAGVERVFELEQELERTTQRMRALERRAARVEEEMRAEMERVRRSLTSDLLPVRRTSRSEIVRIRDVKSLRLGGRRPPGAGGRPGS